MTPQPTGMNRLVLGKKQSKKIIRVGRHLYEREKLIIKVGL